MEEEIWKDIQGYEGMYQISNMGRVKSLRRYSKQNHLLPEKILKPCHSKAGYCDVSLYVNGKRYHEKVHRLVAKAFVSNPKGLNEVDHIDTNKDNNKWNNLKWCTHSENHLNPLTVELKRKINIGKKWTDSQRKKHTKQINVLKNGKIIYKFNGYKEMDEKSKEIFGFTLWNVYVRKVANGEKNDYHGYTFEIIQ